MKVVILNLDEKDQTISALVTTYFWGIIPIKELVFTRFEIRKDINGYAMLSIREWYYKDTMKQVENNISAQCCECAKGVAMQRRLI